MHGNPAEHALGPNAITKRLFFSKWGLVVPICTIALPWRTRTFNTKSGKIPSYNFGVICFRLDVSDYWARAWPYQTMPYHANHSLPWLGEAS